MEYTVNEQALMARPDVRGTIAALSLLFLSALGLGVSPSPAVAFQQDRLVSGDLLDGIPLRLIGPTSPSGRVWQVVGVPDQPKTFFVCTAQAGVWKTNNFGTTITQLFAEDNASSY